MYIFLCTPVYTCVYFFFHRHSGYERYMSVDMDFTKLSEEEKTERAGKEEIECGWSLSSSLVSWRTCEGLIVRFDGPCISWNELLSPIVCSVIWRASRRASPTRKIGNWGRRNPIQKLQEIIRADPEKAEKMYEKFREILIEERRDDLICIHCPLLNHRDDWNEKHMSGSHSYSPGSGSLKILNWGILKVRRLGDLQFSSWCLDRCDLDVWVIAIGSWYTTVYICEIGILIYWYMDLYISMGCLPSR